MTDCLVTEQIKNMFCTVQVALKQSLQVKGAEEEVPHHGGSRGGMLGSVPSLFAAEYTRALHNFDLKDYFTSHLL